MSSVILMHNRYYSRSFKIFLLGIDLILFDLSFVIAYLIRFESGIFLTEEYFSLLMVFNLIWVIAAPYNKVYDINRFSSIRKFSGKLLYTFLLHLLLISACLVAFKAYGFSRLFLVYTYSISITLLLFLRGFYFWVIRYYRRTGYNSKKAIIVGTGKSAKQLYDYFHSELSSGHSFMGFFEDNPNGNCPGECVLGGVNDIKSYCLSEKVNEIFYAKSLTDSALIDDLTNFADKNFIYLKFVPDFRGLQKSKVDISFFQDVPIINYTKAPLGSFFNRMVKRAFDVMFSLMVICLVFPILFPLIALCIKLESKGPILFKQFRPGKDNKLFECFKFRTMYINGNTELQASKSDPRITKVGKFLRRTSLDELPQFFNVLSGDMSVVGPRPNLISQLEYYSKEIDKYNFRHFIVPGITGYAQVSGYRGETRDMQLMRKRVEYDAWYIENWRLTLDLKIILLTVWKMIKGDRNAF